MRRTRIRPNCVAPATERPPTAEHGPRHRHSGVVALGERDLRRSIQPARSLATQTSNIRYARSWYQVGVGRGTTGPSIDRWSSVYWLRGSRPEDSSRRRQAQGCGRADTRHLALRADGNEALPPCRSRASPLLSGSMRHVRLGRTGLRVSRLCLGTMTFGLQCDEPTSVAILDRAAAGGITFLDTSDVYPLGGGLDTVGRTEEIVGRWLAGRRQDFVVATKCFGSMSARPWDRGLSRKHVLDAIEGSLRRLRTDYVDLYQLHHPDPETPMDETLRALDDVVRAGKARYIGCCSNYFAYQV